MKKSIRKPENWQDFESLCKKLWGEIWEIPNEVKKNGRLGQPQSGVDVYGIPKNKCNYYGIQVKGKDDYTDAKLKKTEIEKEISKARNFKPKLEEFIIATTANKDSEIEEFIRTLDLQNRKKSDFKILLFCWEDIADLIEENKETFNWYVNENNFREKFDVSITFENESNEIEIISKFQKTITKYVQSNSVHSYLNSFLNKTPKNYYPFESNTINQSWNKIKINIKNSGSVVIEDWKITFQLDENCREIDDDFELPLFMANEIKATRIQNRTVFADSKNKILKYRPVSKNPLIQKDVKTITGYIKTYPKNGFINIKWEFLARDFFKVGTLKINVVPKYIDNIKYFLVENENEIREDEVTKIEDYITPKN